MRPARPVPPLRRAPAALLGLLCLAGCTTDRPTASSGPGASAPAATAGATGGDAPAATATAAPGTAPTGAPVAPSPTAAATTTAPPPSLVTTPRPTDPTDPVDPLRPGGPTETPPPAGGVVCAPATLSVVDADTVTSATTVQEVFVLRTTGTPCVLRGHPSVQFLGAGRPVPVTATQVGTARPVGLSRPSSVSFTVTTPRTGRCTAVDTVVVRPPGSATPLRADTSLRVCGATVSISPIRRAVDTEG